MDPHDLQYFLGYIQLHAPGFILGDFYGFYHC